jgi:GNAT superfamily N-acetyltransferase
MKIRLLERSDLADFEALFRTSFSAHLGIGDPKMFSPGSTLGGRFTAVPDGQYGAHDGDKLVAAIGCTNWGSFGFFGPLVVLPEYWGRGLAQQLLEKSDEFFKAKKIKLAGLYTFANSPKHLALYQKYDYWPKQLTCLMSKAVGAEEGTLEAVRFSQVDAARRSALIAAQQALLNGIYQGLDVAIEIDALYQDKVGDTIFLEKDGKVSAVAVCHFGQGSEATSNNCYIKFAAAKDESEFKKLLSECAKLSRDAGVTHIIGGVNTARHEAYRAMGGAGFRSENVGVALIRNNEDGFNKAGVFVIDDWR